MQILVKFPTRSRPHKALSRLDELFSYAEKPENIRVLISYDADDPSMNQEWVKNALSKYGATLIRGTSENKIHAVNRDMEISGDWDIGVLLSDDMVCQQTGWDTILVNTMKEHFPDTNGALWFWDGDPNTQLTFDHRGIRNKGLCTMNIFGRKWFEFRGGWYKPEYKSLWCDNEETDVMMNEFERYYEGKGKYFYSDRVLFRHVHYSNTRGEAPDELMRKTQTFYHVDKMVYEHRKMKNFDLVK